MTLKNLVASDYGQAIVLTFIDTDDSSAEDISGYATLQMLFEKPDGTAVTKTAAFNGDGTDGKIKYTIEESFLVAGKWRVKGRALTTGTKQLTTVEHVFTVLS